jgi:hypothetical protein
MNNTNNNQNDMKRICPIEENRTVQNILRITLQNFQTALRNNNNSDLIKVPQTGKTVTHNL